MDERERQSREAAQQIHDDLVEVEEAATKLPPIAWGEWTLCGTPGCGNRTAAYWKMADGALVPICGACAGQTLDHVIEQQRQERNARNT